MQKFNKLLLGNKLWAEEKKSLDQDYFSRLSQDQKPDFLWIGCSDSRVPPNEMTGSEPGEMFVHRNIANLVIHTDLNVMSVLHYAVEFLKVSHVIVCGHYGCGGVKAGMTNKNFGLLNRWITQIRDIYTVNKKELDAIPNEDDRTNKLVELVTLEQLYNVAKTSVVQQAWKGKQEVYLHACVYDMNNGSLHLLKTLDAANPGLPPIYLFP